MEEDRRGNPHLTQPVYLADFRCRTLAEQHNDDIDLHPSLDRGWLGSLCHPGLLHAGIGHALAGLAMHTVAVDGGVAKAPVGVVGAEVRNACAQAAERLACAIGMLDETGHARARTLCLAQLAQLQLVAGDLDDAAHWTRPVLRHAASIGSARLDRGLALIRATTVERFPNEPVMRQLVEEIDAFTGQPAQRQSTTQHQATFVEGTMNSSFFPVSATTPVGAT